MMKTSKVAMPLPALLFAVVMSLMASCGQKAGVTTLAERTGETQSLLLALKQLQSDGQYMFGHEDAPCYGIGWVGDSARSDVMSVCGDMPAVLGFDLGHIELGHAQNLDGVPFSTIRQEAIRHFEQGGVVTMSWHLDNPLTGGTCWTDSDEDGKAVAAILAGGDRHDKFLSWLDRVADFLQSLQTDDGVPVPVIFRPWHEHNASWFWYGQDFCTASQYKELWHITVSKLSERGVVNVLYAYSPTAEGGIDEERYMERYPGDDIIDLMGLDCYCFAENGDSLQVAAYAAGLDADLAVLTAIAKKHDKAAALTEAGYEGVKDNHWWTAVLAPALKSNPVSYALVWRNAHDKPGHFYGPYPGHSSADDFVSFYNLPETLFLKDVNGLYQKNK